MMQHPIYNLILKHGRGAGAPNIWADITIVDDHNLKVSCPSLPHTVNIHLCDGQIFIDNKRFCEAEYDNLALAYIWQRMRLTQSEIDDENSYWLEILRKKNERLKMVP